MGEFYRHLAKDNASFMDLALGVPVEKVRAKRSVSLEHNAELMIVTDKTMVDYHGESLESYVLYLVAVVCLHHLHCLNFISSTLRLPAISKADFYSQGI